MSNACKSAASTSCLLFFVKLTVVRSIRCWENYKNSDSRYYNLRCSSVSFYIIWLWPKLWLKLKCRGSAIHLVIVGLNPIKACHFLRRKNQPSSTISHKHKCSKICGKKYWSIANTGEQAPGNWFWAASGRLRHVGGFLSSDLWKTYITCILWL